jgi:hypothetical protein
MIIKELQKPIILKEEDGYFKILSGYVDDTAFWFWYAGSQEVALRKAEETWEAVKKSYYGSNTHIETIREGELPLVDKYKAPT